MSGPDRQRARASTEARARDLVRTPIVGAVLRWRGLRRTLQVAMAALALLLVVHGLFGPQLAPKNLATLLVWVHWRGALVIGLLVLGNVFCMGCPLLLPRELARRVFAPVRRMPRALRRKWTGVVLLVLVLFLYEWLDLWADPRATAVAILGYFALALAVDAVFAGAPFCKWVCPIGQFNFVASTFSPFEVRARDRDVCGACSTKDCIKGRPDPVEPERVLRRGCELALFLPEKVGNVDCTFCMDCLHACPEDNVAVTTRVPGAELVDDSVRSGVGRLSRRPDIALLVVVFTFGALLNAFAMVTPVYGFQRSIAGALGTESELIVLAALFALGLVVVPALALGVTCAGGRALAGLGARVQLARFSLTLAPIGFGVWLAHYCFHFLTGLWTFVPVAQHAAERAGIGILGTPRWGLGGLTEAQVWPVELGFLGLGLLGSLSVTWRLARDVSAGRTARAFAPWGLLHVAVAAAAVWLLAQPMEMRGTFL